MLTIIGTYRFHGNQRSMFVCAAALLMPSTSFVDLNAKILGDPLDVLTIEATFVQETEPCLWYVAVGNGIFETMTTIIERHSGDGGL